MDRAQDRRPEERPGGHAQERQRADDPERPWARGTAEQVRGGRRPDRHENAATDRLDQPRGDELVEALGRARQRGSDDEHDQRAR